jgi:hypothetical protein
LIRPHSDYGAAAGFIFGRLMKAQVFGAKLDRPIRRA